MSWLIVAILAYFILAVVSLGDKYLLSGAPNPKVYSFYVGLLSSLTFLLIPFVGLYNPGVWQIILSLVSGIISIAALYFLFTGLENFEASRVIPSIGAMTPVFTFLFSFLFFGEVLSVRNILAFFFLLLGGVIISYNKKVDIPLSSLVVTSLAAAFFALHFVLSKYIYLEQSFWNGFIIMRMGALIVSFFLVFTKDVREEIFSKKSAFNRKTGSFFVVNQGAGAGAFVMQHFSIYLAGPIYLPIIAALQGTQYAFLFVMTILLSLKTPWIIKEEVKGNIVFQKTLAIIIIVLGLVILNV